MYVTPNINFLSILFFPCVSLTNDFHRIQKFSIAYPAKQSLFIIKNLVLILMI